MRENRALYLESDPIEWNNYLLILKLRTYTG